MRMKSKLVLGLCVAMALQNLPMVSLAEIGAQKNETEESRNAVDERKIETPFDADEEWEEEKEENQGEMPEEEFDSEEEEEMPDEAEKIEGLENQLLMNRAVVATPADAVYVSDETALQEAVMNSGTVVVEGEIALTETLVIPDGKEIDLRGGQISFAGNNQQRWMIHIKNSKVTLSDIVIDNTGMDCDVKVSSTDNRLTDYYAIFSSGDAEINIEEGTVITNSDSYSDLTNHRKSGIWISGTGEMNGGTISGFPDAALKVGRSTVFTLNDGEVVNNRGIGIAIAGGQNEGTGIINGGAITDNNGHGIFNNGRLKLTGGIIENNSCGIFNNNEDGITHEKFYPVADISGGLISNNRNTAITNENRGTVNISGNAEIHGALEMASQLSTMAVKSNAEEKAVIANRKQAILKIDGGSITSESPDEIAVFNDETGTVEMTAGTITASGARSVAIKNASNTTGGVKISGGSIQATGEDSQTIDNQGKLQISGDVVIEANGVEELYVGVSYNEGGSISPTSQQVTKGQAIDFTITPDSGYRTKDVLVDGVSQGRITSYQLTVTGKHRVEAVFEKISSGTSHSSSGGGGSSRVSGTIKAKPAIPETPGTWKKDTAGWKFLRADGTSYVNDWIYVKSHWYRVGADGYMLQGWTDINGKRYYLTPVSGEMKTGWLFDNQVWYYLDETGLMKTSWAQVNGKWYYLNPDGKMAANTRTPDGYQVNENGEWIH
ncbi:MAG: hypothetical protein KHZ58_18325 [Hungatella hathewayi]|nr:hypothetical protein [Hungatella hathewayi]